MSYLQYGATILSIIYILLAVRNKPICFLFGGLSTAIWAFEDFINLNLIYDGFLQIFYTGMAVYGWANWRSSNKNISKIKKLTFSQNVWIVGLGIPLSFLVAWVCSFFFNTTLPYLDATTTAFSIIATFLLTKRYVDNWIYWMIINPVYVYIYWKTGAWLFVGIMILFTIMAINGYLEWKKLMTRKPSTVAFLE